MTAKPATLPRFAHDGANPAANIVEPSSGQKDTGWTSGQSPPSGYFNWIHRWTYEWLAFLNSAVVDFGSAQLVADSIGVDTISPESSSEVTVAAPLVLNGNLVNVSGDHYHSDRVLGIPASAIVPTSAWAYQPGGYIQSSGSGSVYPAIPLRQGDRIKSITLGVFGNGSADITAIDVIVWHSDGTSTVISPGTTVTDPAGLWADVTVNVTDTILAAGDAIAMEIVGNAAGLRIGNIRVTYDRPAP